MNVLNIAQYMQTLGLQAKTACAQVARAPAATKNKALRSLAALLRQNGAVLEAANQRDLERAAAAGLAGPLLDRLKLGAKDIETVALGCEQLAAMPDVIGEITALREQPSGIRVGQMRVPIGVFGMIYESRPNVTIEAASLAIKSGNACILRGAPRPSSPTRRWPNWFKRRCGTPACRPMRCNWWPPPTAKPSAT
jgi:glutamate-5-semialdehyde dehydrogenase